MLLEKEDNEDVLAFLEQHRERARTEELLEILQQRSLSTTQASSLSDDFASLGSDEEEDVGLKYPRAFELSQADFQTGLDYVKSFVKETRAMHRGDVHNEERKSKSLGNVFTTESLQPECFRAKLSDTELYLTAMIPVL